MKLVPTKLIAGSIQKRGAYALFSVSRSYEKHIDSSQPTQQDVYDQRIPSHVYEGRSRLRVAPARTLPSAKLASHGPCLI